MIIMFLISLVLLCLVIPNLKVKKRIRPNEYTRWSEYKWEYLGRYKLKVWKYIILFIVLLIPLVNIICSIIGFILLCVPIKCFENKGDEGWDLEETVIYLEWSDKISSFLNKEI